MTVPIGAWLTRKELQFCEETTYGTLPASPNFTPIGYEPRLMFRLDPKMLVIPQPGNEDPETIQAGNSNEITWDITYRMTDTIFAKYGVNAQGGGSGTIDKSLTLLMSVKLSATTETWIILQGARPEITTISGRAGGVLEARVIGKSQTLPLPVQSDPGYTYATSFLPQNRQITGNFAICWETLGLLTILGTQTAPNMVWTLSTTLGSALTVGSTQFTKLNSLQFSNGEPAVFENYAYQATFATLT